MHTSSKTINYIKIKKNKKPNETYHNIQFDHKWENCIYQDIELINGAMI
jgi:hypothetical protein